LGNQTFRFLQTGDLHIGTGRETFGEALVVERGDRLLSEILRVAKAQHCDAILITGDVTDTKRVTDQEREVITRGLLRMGDHDTGMPTYVISGNHDLKSAKVSNLDYMGEASVCADTLLRVAFAREAPTWSLPGFPNLLVVGGSVGFSEDPGWLADFCANLVTHNPETGDPLSYIFMGHGTIRGCMINDMGRYHDEAADAKHPSLAAVDRPEICWWAYGDIHKRQPLPGIPPLRGCYAGSPIQMNFGETPDRGVSIVTMRLGDDDRWAARTHEYVRLDHPEVFLPLLTIREAEDLAQAPEKALYRLAKGLVLPTATHDQVVRTLKVVLDQSSRVKDTEQGLPVLAEADQLFDALFCTEAEAAEHLLGDFQGGDLARKHARQLVGRALDVFRARTYLS
jgi:DNA repair exonuclease SbcCD nuclease subunit